MPYCKIISGIGATDLGRVRRLATLYTWAGADWLDVALSPQVVMAAHEGIRHAGANGPRVMVSLGLAGDPHVGTALLDVAVCATCAGCVIPELKTCAERPLQVRAPECPSCQACIGACPLGAIRMAAPWSGELDVLAACLQAGAQGVELHVSGASVVDAIQQVQLLHAYLPAEAWLSVSVGAEVQGADEAVAIVAATAALGRQRWMAQVEGPPMSLQVRDGTSEDASLALVRAVLAALPDAPVQIAGGTGLHTGARCRALGLNVCGIGFGTAARLAVARALEDLELTEAHPDVEEARALVASTRGKP